MKSGFERLQLVMMIVVFVCWVDGALAQECEPQLSTRLGASDAAAYSYYGRAVAMRDDTLFIGASSRDEYGNDSGSVYVYAQTADDWVELGKLYASDAHESQQFGNALAVSGDTLVVGAYGDDTQGRFTGALYVFVLDGNEWVQQAKLIASDANEEDYFGTRVSIDGDTIVTGSVGNDDLGQGSGSAYVFVRSGDLWSEQAKLLPDDGSGFESFGSSVSVSGDTIIVGAMGDDDNGESSGSAYVFRRSSDVWEQEAKLLADDGAYRDEFGYPVRLYGDTAIIGAARDEGTGGWGSGAVYVFERQGEVWAQQAKVFPPARPFRARFGIAFSLSDETLLVGAPGRGADAYVFQAVQGEWNLRSRIIVPNVDNDDSFASDIALRGNLAFIGAAAHDADGMRSGSVFALDLNCQSCTADLNGDGVLNFFDVSVFLVGFLAQDSLSDWNGDGAWDGFDVSAFFGDYTLGCP